MTSFQPDRWSGYQRGGLWNVKEGSTDGKRARSMYLLLCADGASGVTQSHRVPRKLYPFTQPSTPRRANALALQPCMVTGKPYLVQCGDVPASPSGSLNSPELSPSSSCTAGWWPPRFFLLLVFLFLLKVFYVPIAPPLTRNIPGKKQGNLPVQGFPLLILSLILNLKQSLVPPGDVASRWPAFGDHFPLSLENKPRW